MAMGEIHTSPIAKKFLKKLNLDSGRALFEKCNQFWSHYSEVIKNRKSTICSVINAAITQNEATQVIIFGAGFDALSLEISSWSKNCKVFEIDVANMNLKKNLINNVDSSLADSIKCITMDISNPCDVQSNLTRHGWRKDLPSLILFEGISYYLKSSVLWKIIAGFTASTHSNRVIMEYFLPAEKISKQYTTIAEYPFSLIASESDLASITRYELKEIKTQIKKLDGVLLQHFTMQKMEKNRTLQNTIFQANQNGWIEICEFLV